MWFLVWALACTHSLSLPVLVDFLGKQRASAYLASRQQSPGFDTASSCRVTAVGLLLQSPSLATLPHLGVTSVAAPLLDIRCTGDGYASSLLASSNLPRTSEAPLMAWPSRGDVSPVVSPLSGLGCIGQDVFSGSGQAVCGSSVSAGAVDDDIAPGYGVQCSEVSLPSESSLSAIPAVTSPLVVPTRGHLDSIRRLMTGDRYIGRGSKQRALVKSIFHNPFKVSEYGRDLAIQLFEQHLDSSRELQRQIPSLSGTRLVCHCKPQEDCHADALIRKFKELFPDAYDRSLLDQRPPTSSELNLLARQREEVSSDEGSSPDEGAPLKGSGWQGTGKPMLVGVIATGRHSRRQGDGR